MAVTLSLSGGTVKLKSALEKGNWRSLKGSDLVVSQESGNRGVFLKRTQTELTVFRGAEAVKWNCKCYNRFVREVGEDSHVVHLTQDISSAFFPRFSPDGKFLVFLSAKSSVDSGAHSATDSLHNIEWPTNGKLGPTLKVFDVVPVVMCPKDGGFPGLYVYKFLSHPWLSDGHTMVLSSMWRSTLAILSVDILSGKVSRISPNNSNSSWDIFGLDGDHIIAVSNSPVDINS